MIGAPRGRCLAFCRPIWHNASRRSIGTTAKQPRSTGAPRKLNSTPNGRTNPNTDTKARLQPDEVVPGEHVQAVCRKYNIGFPTQMSFLMKPPKPNDGKLSILYSRRHCFDVQNMKYLDSFQHPLRNVTLDRYIAQAETPLWWSASCFNADTKPVVLSTAKRWLRRGMREALKSHGYDVVGRKIVTEGTHLQDLWGTIRINCHDGRALVKMGFPTVLEQMQQVVQAARTQLARGQTGRHFASKSTSSTDGDSKRIRQGTRGYGKSQITATNAP